MKERSAFLIVFLVLIARIIDDSINESEQEKMAKVMQMLSESKYTPIEYNGNNADLISLYEEAIEKFHCTLAARLSEGKILYAIVNEEGNPIGRIDYKDSATFFINNFRI